MWGYFSVSVTLISESLILRYWSTECKVPQMLQIKIVKGVLMRFKKLMITLNHFSILQQHPYQLKIWKMSRRAAKTIC